MKSTRLNKLRVKLKVTEAEPANTLTSPTQDYPGDAPLLQLRPTLLLHLPRSLLESLEQALEQLSAECAEHFYASFSSFSMHLT